MEQKRDLKTASIIVGVVVICVVFVIILVSVFGMEDGQGFGNTKSTTKEGPHYELANLNGGFVSYRDHRDKVVVLNVWATWCPYCIDELPDLKLLQERYPDDVVVVAVNRGESLATARGYLEKENLLDSLVFLLDPDDSMYKQINGFSMPETVFIDSDGEIVSHRRGQVPFEMMVALVEDILISK